MKYNIDINQKAIIELGLPIDLQDGAIIDFIHKWVASHESVKVQFNGQIYVWISHKLISDQIPILGKWKNGKLQPMSKDAVYRRMKNLCELGIIKKHPQSQELGMPMYSVTAILDALIFQKEPSGPFMPGVRSRPP